MKRVMFLVIAFVFIVVGISWAGGETEGYVVGVSISQFTTWLKDMADKIEAEAEVVGNVKIITLNGNADIQKQISDVESLITQKVDAIILNPVDKEAGGVLVDKIKDANIPLVEVNTFTTNDRFDVYVGSREEDAGIQQAKWIIENLGTEGGNIVYLMGVMGHSAQIGRKAGFMEGLIDKYPQWKILSELSCDWQRDRGMSITEDWLQRFPEIDLIVSQNDEGVMGALAAVEASDRKGQIQLLGVDGQPDAVEAVLDGRLAFTTFQDMDTQAKKALEVAIGLIEGKTYPHIVNTPFVPITKENAATFMK